MDFILSDNSINRYDYRVLTSGINLDNFKVNPVMHYNHDRSSLPIGKWTNIRIEGGKLMATPEFDEKDELAMRVKDKVEKGILNAASIHFNVEETTQSPEEMMAGQKRPTVSKCDLVEASIVDIPGNKSAIKLSFAGKGLTLSGDAQSEFLDLVLPRIIPIKKDNQKRKMDKIALSLGLSADATEDQIVAVIKANEAKAQNQVVEDALAYAKGKGVKEDAPLATVKRLAAVDAGAAREFVDGIAPKGEAAPEGHLSLAQAIQELAKTAGKTEDKEDRTKWTLSQWKTNDMPGLVELKDKNPAAYNQLFKK